MHRLLRLLRPVVMAGFVAGAPFAARGADGVAPWTKLGPVTDPSKRVSVALPPGTPAPRVPATEDGVLAVWEVDADGDPATAEIRMRAEARDEWARVRSWRTCGLAASPGAVQPGTEAWTATAWTAECSGADSRRIVRAVEFKGTVYVATAEVALPAWDAWKEHARRLVAGFTPAEGFRAPDVPPGFARLAFDGLDVWSDAKKADAESVVRAAAATVEAAGKLLSGNPFTPGPPRILVCASADSYAAAWRVPGTAPPPVCHFDAPGRRVVIDGSSRAAPGFAGTVQFESARAAVARHFGGAVPAWIDRGFAWLAVDSLGGDGRPETPEKPSCDIAKGAVRRSGRSFEQVMDAGPPDASAAERFSAEAAMWHIYLRWGGGEEAHGLRYRRTLESARKDGDWTAARDRWKDADHAALTRSLNQWMETWLPPGSR